MSGLGNGALSGIAKASDAVSDHLVFLVYLLILFLLCSLFEFKEMLELDVVLDDVVVVLLLLVQLLKSL